ncbi:MAG: hypothetical protein ACYC9J_01340 [Sulfuricaulis sp.]
MKPANLGYAQGMSVVPFLGPGYGKMSSRPENVTAGQSALQ